MTALGNQDLLPGEKVWPLIFWFLGFLVVFSALADSLLIAFGLKRNYMVLTMWAPGLAAFAALKRAGLPLAMLDWAWPSPRLAWASYLLPLFYGLLAYGIIWLWGLGGLGNPKFIDEAEYYLGISDWGQTATLAFSIAMLASAGMLWHIATALGEEIGWRGFLVPLLMRRLGFAGTSLAIGTLWAIWHVPIIFFAGYNAGPEGLWWQFLFFALLCIGQSFIMTYLRLRSKSLWSAAIFHAAHTVFVLFILELNTVTYTGSELYLGQFGFILAAVVLVFALYFWYLAHKEGLAASMHHH